MKYLSDLVFIIIEHSKLIQITRVSKNPKKSEFE